eukprot:4266514-Pleurochrysis_carterae.AAC.2
MELVRSNFVAASAPISYWDHAVQNAVDYARYVRCSITSFRINTPPLAHAAKHARTLPRGTLGRSPPCVHAPERGTRSR